MESVVNQNNRSGCIFVLNTLVVPRRHKVYVPVQVGSVQVQFGSVQVIMSRYYAQNARILKNGVRGTKTESFYLFTLCRHNLRPLRMMRSKTVSAPGTDTTCTDRRSETCLDSSYSVNKRPIRANFVPDPKWIRYSRVVKCDIMRFDQLFRGSKTKNVHLPKISSPLQFSAEI